MKAIRPHAKHVRDQQLLRVAMDQGYLRLFETPGVNVHVEKEWIDQHARYSDIDPREAEGHHRVKIAVAERLDDVGFPIERIENSDDDPARPYLYGGFEMDTPFGVADIGIPEAGVYAEIGRVNPYRILTAFGLQATLIRGVWHDEDRDTRRVYSVPVEGADREASTLTVYEFRRGPELSPE